MSKLECVVISDNGEVKTEKLYGRKNILRKLHSLGNLHIHGSNSPKVLSTDMDGVLIVDDNALDVCRIIAGKNGIDYFSEVGRRNIRAVEEEAQTSYCWNAPCVFLGSLLQGLPSEVNRAVGSHMRFVPGARENIEHLLELGFDVTNVTAGHQEGAEEVSKRLGIKRTIATQFGIDSQGKYDGTIQRFIGGNHKLKAIDSLFEKQIDGYSTNNRGVGSHVGDSHSDIESMRALSSIAWNPTHHLATTSAVMNVYGLNKMGLTPLYDSIGRFDSVIPDKALPHTIVINARRVGSRQLVGQDTLELQYKLGSRMREEYMSQIESEYPHEQMMEYIRRQIQKNTGMTDQDFADHVISVRDRVFLPLDDFQTKSLNAYTRLN